MIRSWRHLDFFQYEAWLHADVPRIQCPGVATQAGSADGLQSSSKRQ